ncbi:hypothetical protein D9756_010650 [Leucocoprinus leucothites]|nr:hypothetical protein D9756_010650 [Leucoagaricus leucothites]
MPSLSFEGASNFTISGGNFNDVDGNVITYNFSNGLQDLPPNTLAALAPQNVPNKTGNRLSRSERKKLAAREQMASPLPSAHIQSVPSSVAPSSPPAMAMSPSSHPSRSQRSTLAAPPVSPALAYTPSPVSDSSFDSGFERYDTPSPRSSRHSTPPTDIEEHRNVGSSGVSAPAHELDPDTLTPLTNSLGLQRFTPGTISQTLPTLPEVPTPVQAPTQNLSPATESPAEFGLELRRTPSGPPPPPPASTRPVSRTPRVQALPELVHLERRDPLGPPPPVPPRPVMLSPTWTSTTAPVDTPFRLSRPMSTAPTTPTQAHRSASPDSQALASMGPVTEQSELEDPAVRFARLQSQRSPTKGYASGLSSSSRGMSNGYTPSTPSAMSRPPPPPSATRPTSLPASSIVTPSPNLAPDQALAPIPQFAAPQAPHWTQHSISGWAGEVNGRGFDSDTLSSGDSRSVRPPTSPPHQQGYPYDEQQYHHQPPAQHHYHNVGSHNPAWGGAQPHAHQQPFGFNQAPNPPFAPFPFNNPPPFTPLGVPFFNGPAFGGPAFGGGFAFPG